jgi:XisI protein
MCRWSETWFLQTIHFTVGRFGKNPVSFEDDIAEDLVIAGVPKEDIVWGFQPPLMRKYTSYAVK